MANEIDRHKAIDTTVILQKKGFCTSMAVNC